jgi:hypothetical protein
MNPGEKDYSAIVGKLKALGTEALYCGGYPTALCVRLPTKGALDRSGVDDSDADCRHCSGIRAAAGVTKPSRVQPAQFKFA